MSSNERETRQRQKTEAEATVEARIAKLKEAGLDEKQLARDPLLRRAKALVKKANTRIKAIDAKDALNQALAQSKAQGKNKAKDKGKAAKGQSKPKKAKKAK